STVRNVSATGGIEDLLARARRAAEAARFQTRTEAQLWKSVEMYKDVLDVDPDNREALNTLSLGYFTLAEAYLPEEERIESYEKGYEYGLKSLRTDKNFDRTYKEKGFSTLKNLPESVNTNVEGLFWTGANLGRASEQKGILESLGTLPALVEINRRIIAVDEGYLGGAAHRTIGSISAEVLKRSPLTFIQIHNNGFSWEKTEEHFLKAIEMAPGCLENYFSYAKYYALNRNKKELARENLQKVIDRPLGDEFPLINSLAKRKAQEIFAREEFNADG
ncbi:hypothetical protein KGY64_01980, partial [Candidatus Bipolaricaulota bacterium]|nr:hypothetical protein [Candidatus Bipolaricaulota bacterium]